MLGLFVDNTELYRVADSEELQEDLFKQGEWASTWPTKFRVDKLKVNAY